MIQLTYLQITTLYTYKTLKLQERLQFLQGHKAQLALGPKFIFKSSDSIRMYTIFMPHCSIFFALSSIFMQKLRTFGQLAEAQT